MKQDRRKFTPATNFLPVTCDTWVRNITLVIQMAVIALISTGCFPARFTTSPGASGRVIDARTRDPVQGAEVFVSRAFYKFYTFTNHTMEGVAQEGKTIPPPEPPPLNLALSKSRPPIVLTDADGRFDIPPVKRWGIYIVPMDIAPSHGALVVRRDGYVPEMRLVITHSSIDPVGDISLNRVAE
jgi:hypothetical protein